MPLSEFELIERFFFREQNSRSDVVLGIGDDAAVLKLPQGHELVVAMDTLVEGVHFHGSIDPALIAYKALAVNLSDLAAMGAEPTWATLSLTLPMADEVWMERFSAGFFELADQYEVQLIGGDTSQGPLSVTVQAHGLLPEGKALRRKGACPGDLIYVTGTIGDAGLALKMREGDIKLPEIERERLYARLDRPQPRIAEGLFLRDVASSAIDISDGLVADLGHILNASHIGGTIYMDTIPLSKAFINGSKQLSAKGMSIANGLDWRDMALSSGDDYELCFTVPEKHQDKIHEWFSRNSVSCTRIGFINEQPGLRCVLANGDEYHPVHHGYEHFKS